MKDKLTAIFHKITADKKRARRIIVIFLVIADLLLINYFRDPLIRKYFTDTPKAFSASDLATNRRYLVSYGDYVLGKNAPDSTAILFLRVPGQKTKISKVTNLTTAQGEWVYRIPEGIPEGRYSFIAGFLDAQNNLLDAKVYRLRVNTNVSLYRTVLFRNLQKNYSSNLTLQYIGANYDKWLEDISSVKIFPAQVSNEAETSSSEPEVDKQEILGN